MNACPTCPNRHHADTLDALAEAAAGSLMFRAFAPVLRRRAQQVREAGCNNWKRLKYDLKDSETGQVLEETVREKCMRDHLPAWFNAVTKIAEDAERATESHRNVVAEGFTILAGRPVTGDGYGLPVEIRELLGLPTTTPPKLESGQEGQGR